MTPLVRDFYIRVPAALGAAGGLREGSREVQGQTQSPEP